MDRRTFLGGIACACAAAAVGCRSAFGRNRRLAMNASTLRGYGLSLLEQVKVAVAAGYEGYEPWLKDIRAAKASGELAEAVRVAAGGGLRFVNGIAFGQWSHQDAGIRAAGLEETKRDMASLAEMGCPLVAASMYGMQKADAPRLSNEAIAERFAAVCALGDRMGVKPLLEYWGHSVNLHRLEDALDVLALVGRADTAVLADVYHTYRGGGDFAAFSRLRVGQLPVLHVNDYPLTKPRAELVDADRVWPGAGHAPWKDLFARLDAGGHDPWLSIELFNPAYWRTTPLETLMEGRRRMAALV